MDISLAGIEEAIGGLEFRETSPKARLIRAIHAFYKKSKSPDEVRSIDSDELIDLMWDLGGDRKAIRSRRKNLSSIKSSVNVDLDSAWEEGRNPEGITIGPLNTFVMSDAAKDKILNSFSGSMGLEGGKSLDRVVEALKIVSDYISKMPEDVEDEQLSYLKSLTEGLSEKFREAGSGGFEVIEKNVMEAEPDELEFVEEGPEGETEAAPEEYLEEIEFDEVFDNETEEIELMDEEDLIELVEVLEDDGEPEGVGEGKDEDVIELVGAEGLEKTDEVNLVDENGLREKASMMEDGLADVNDESAVVEEVMEEEGALEADEEISAQEQLRDDIGLSVDLLTDDLQNLEKFKLDGKQKRLLAERFDGYLGAMERYYNQYIFIRKGNYRVGAHREGEDVLNEHQVLMPDYYIGKYPVTNALFEVFIERTGYRTTAERLGYGYVYHGRFRKIVDSKTGFTSSTWNSTYTREKVKGAAWYQPLGPGSALHKKRNHPVVQVSIQDARTFAAWTGKRLPSEIEWEAAARSQIGFRYPWGNEWIEGFCNFENSGVSDTCPVDHFPHSANEEGLADLLGNVMEWTSDECEPKYPIETPARFFIAKGGSWVSPEQTALYSRNRLEADFTSNTLGFRCLAD